MIWFFWDGGVSSTRLKIMQDCVNSTIYFNDEEVVVMSNTLNQSDFKCEVRKWDASIFEGTPIPISLYEKLYKNTSPREKSDLIRLALLYKFGGSYIDTDDLGIRKMSNKSNVVCRSYDPHTAWYNKIKDEECIPGTRKEIRGYDHIPTFPRNDCWQNFEPKTNFLKNLLTDKRVLEGEKAIFICDDFSWQSLTLEYLKKHPETNYSLTLLYLYESHVAASSVWDMGAHGGEMHDLYKILPDITLYPHGKYLCTEKTALEFYEKVINIYPDVSHLWLHDKDMNPDWLKRDYKEKELISTWILKYVREKI